LPGELNFLGSRVAQAVAGRRTSSVAAMIGSPRFVLRVRIDRQAVPRNLDRMMKPDPSRVYGAGEHEILS